MNCTICLDENIQEVNMTMLECGHTICVECYNKLIRNLCPFCRHIISNKKDNSYNIIFDDMITDDLINNIYDTHDQIDNVIPQSDLDTIINDFQYNTYYPNLTENLILRRLNKRKCKKNKNKKYTSNFKSNKDRYQWERRSKKNKKRRSYN